MSTNKKNVNMSRLWLWILDKQGQKSKKIETRTPEVVPTHI